MQHTKLKIERRKRRQRHIRKRLIGTGERPRLSVFRSNTNIYAQIIDDFEGRTLVAACSRSKDTGGGNKAAAEIVGTTLAEQALQHGINTVCFDRGGYRFHGRVKALAEAARKAGLKF